MATCVILSRFSPEAFQDPKDFRDMASGLQQDQKPMPRSCVEEKLCDLGRFDVVDVIKADDQKQIEKAVMIIRAFGHCTHR